MLQQIQTVTKVNIQEIHNKHKKKHLITSYLCLLPHCFNLLMRKTIHKVSNTVITCRKFLDMEYDVYKDEEVYKKSVWKKLKI